MEEPMQINGTTTLPAPQQIEVSPMTEVTPDQPAPAPDDAAETPPVRWVDPVIQAEIEVILADITEPWEPGPIPDPTSGLCAERWDAELGGQYICLLDPGHDGDHDAQITHLRVVA
jgi:hypothetical protein